MTVLDAYAVLAFLRNEPAAGPVARLLDGPTVLAATNLGEVIDQLVRVVDDVHSDLALLVYLGMQIEPITGHLGSRAGELRARHYHRVARPLSLADCAAAALALALRRPLATSDPPLAAMTRAEGGSVLPLPDSRGRLP